MEPESETYHFPKEFLWGTATSEYQISGSEYCPSTQWALWESHHRQKHFKHKGCSEAGVHGWRLYREDILKMKELGVNSYRFSIEWSLIEPEEGYFDEEVLSRYKEKIAYLKEHGIVPMVTLHHFTNPVWFEKRKGFEREENIASFLRFGQKCFEVLGKDANYWCTINEPNGYALASYLGGFFPPGKVSPKKMGLVIRNLLKTHCLLYDLLKQMDGGKEAQIGLVYLHMKFSPYHKWNLLERYLTKFITYALTNSLLHFLKTGIYRYTTPLFSTIEFEEKQIHKKLDFVGLNFYGNPVISQKLSLKEPFGVVCVDPQRKSEYGFCTSGEGFEEAILMCSELDLPIYITENGVADNHDLFRSQFIDEHLRAINNAIKKGANVCGYYHWSLLDNFEWAEGWSKKFGLYAVDPVTKQRTLKKSAETYMKWIKLSRSEP